FLMPRFTIRLCASSLDGAEARGPHGLIGACLSAGEQRHGSCKRQAHHVEVAAFDAWNPTGGVALDAVGSGLIHGLATHEVVDELFFVDEVEEDLGDLDLADHP